MLAHQSALESHECHAKLIENQQDLANWVKDSEGPIDLAVAFWGEGAIDELGLTNAKRRMRILLDLSMGGTNPDVVKAMMKLPHLQVMQHPKLHAKTYISGRGVVIGSANASANGLGVEGSEATRWHELGCLIYDDHVVQDTKQWFELKWAAAKPISITDLKKAERTWAERQRLRPKVDSKIRDILAAATANPSAFRNRGIYVDITTEEWDAKGDADAKDYKQRTGHEALGWQDWTSIPKNANLICFSFYKGEGFQWDEPKVCYSPGKLNRHKSLVLVSASTLDDGFKLDRITTWRQALERAKSAIPREKWRAESGLCMDLGEFAARFGKDAETNR
ncbi:MAG: phospholipase D family protein [Vulcanimicrobiaceae bacterium]